ncbi:MAG: HEAT repeat domain-containing protein, partial [Candidatus Methanoperedens sp.]|nr:HEAT repeat domain-containing protein [Candidatus Methanoperedens sp.]
LRKLGAIALLGLIEGLFHARPVVRRNAATLLGELEDARAVDPFIQALRDPDYEVRRAADKALVSIGEPSVEPLIRALRDPDTNVRSAAASALGELKDARAVEPFIQALRDPEWWVRQRAASALGELKDTRAVEPLIQGLQDTSVYVQRAAVWALGELKNTRAIKPLAQLLADETSPPLERRRICDYAASALREIGTPEALEELRKWGGTIIED